MGIASFLSLSNCEKEAEVKPRDYPYVITNSPKVNEEGAEFSANIANVGNQEILKYGFVWSEISNPTILDNNKLFEGMPKKGIYTYNINSGLTKGHTYYVRAYILTERYEVFGNEKSFNSLGSLPPEIIDFSPKKGYAGEVIIITGKNFSNNPKNILVEFGDNIASIDSSSFNNIFVKSPVITENKKVNICVTISEMRTISKEQYNVFFGWTKMADYPGLGNHSASCFSINGKGYMLGGREYNSSLYTNGPITKMMWEYNPISNSWSRKNDVYFIETSEDPTFVLKGIAFIYNRNDNNIYRYNPNTDSWEQETKYPGISRKLSYFVIDDEVYLGLGKYNGEYIYDLHKYNPEIKEWSLIAQYPGKGKYRALGFGLKGKGYITGLELDGNYRNPKTDIWEYDKFTNSWNQKNDFPGEARGYATCFILNSKAYIGLGTEQYNYQGFTDFWEYYQESDTWIKKDSYIGDATWKNIAFVIDDKAYVGTGAKSYGGGSSWTIWRSYKDLWEFNPNLE